MTLNDLIIIMSNRVMTLNEVKKQATTAGDLSQVISIESDLLTTEATVNALKKLSQEEE